MSLLLPMPSAFVQAWSPVIEAAATTILAAFGAAVFFQLRMAKQSLDAAQESISVTKEDIQTRLFREAASRSAELIEAFQEIIGQGYEFEEQLKRNHVAFNEWELLDETFLPQSFSDWDAAAAWMISTKTDFPMATRLVNRLESYALYFAKGVADETIAYPIVASVFCSTVRKCAPVIANHRAGGGGVPSGSFENTMTLYSTWNGRLVKSSLEQQQRRLAEASNAIPDRTLPTIGSRDVVKPKAGRLPRKK